MCDAGVGAVVWRLAGGEPGYGPLLGDWELGIDIELEASNQLYTNRTHEDTS